MSISRRCSARWELVLRAERTSAQTLAPDRSL
jgi:hypothetical protein